MSRRGLVGRLAAAGRVAVVSAPAGSGKTVLLRSWIGAAGLAGRAAWVPVEAGERDGQRFWLSVVGALRGTSAGSGLVRALTAAPELDGWAVVERLLKDLARLDERVWLVVDDVHELRSAEARRQLELFLMRGPEELRFVLATRQGVRLGLHRLRLEGELTEIRGGDLRFSLAEAGELFRAAGVELPDSALGMLHARTEGWAAGLRLAALSLAGHEDPGRFAAEFSGSERTVAEYLVAEVLERQSDRVRRLLLVTSVLDRVNGELADLLTGGSGGERVLQELEEANAFVVSLDTARSWFRYHRLFADLLRLELRRAVPGEVSGLHRAAGRWLADRGFAVEAIRHAQAAGDWEMAVRLLAGHWPGLLLDGQAGTAHELLAGFPARIAAADAELAALMAADELARGSLEAAERYLGVAEQGSASVPAGQRGQVRVLLGVVRLSLARQRGDLPAVAEEARRLQIMAEAPDPAQPGLGEDLRALALINLGITEVWAARDADAERHLEHGVALARRIGRPFLEFSGLPYQATIDVTGSLALSAERARQAVELARRHGWTEEPAAGVAYEILGAVLAWQGQFEEAEPWIQRAERTVRPDTEPTMALLVLYGRGLVELGRGRDREALAAFQAAERMAKRLAAPQGITPRMRVLLLLTLVRLGETERAGQVLADLRGTGRRERGGPDRDRGVAAGPGRPARGQRRARAGPGRLRSRPPVGLADSGVRAGGDRPGRARPGRARRPGRGRARPGARAGPGRARRRARGFPAPSRAGPARAPRPASHRARLAAHGGPQPAGRKDARTGGHRAAAAARAAARQRAPRAALPAIRPDRAGDRGRAARLDQHGQDPHAQPVRQARHPPPPRGRRTRPRPGPARPLRTPPLTQPGPMSGPAPRRL